MTADTIREVLYDRPFVPFRIHMGNGRVVEVKHPEMAIVTDQEVAVAVEQAGASMLRLLSLELVNLLFPEFLHSVTLPPPCFRFSKD